MSVWEQDIIDDLRKEVEELKAALVEVDKQLLHFESLYLMKRDKAESAEAALVAAKSTIEKSDHDLVALFHKSEIAESQNREMRKALEKTWSFFGKVVGEPYPACLALVDRPSAGEVCRAVEKALSTPATSPEADKKRYAHLPDCTCPEYAENHRVNCPQLKEMNRRKLWGS